jgi:hypothetical protein
MVLPLSISRWLLFGNHRVPSAATFFSVIMFNLSGAINVLLFLIARPHLLLFPRPEKLAEPVMEFTLQGTSTAIFADRANFQHSPEPTLAALVVGEGSRNSPAPCLIIFSQISQMNSQYTLFCSSNIKKTLIRFLSWTKKIQDNFLTAYRVATTEVATLRTVGLSGRKAEYGARTC